MSSTNPMDKKANFDLKAVLLDKLKMLLFVLVLGSVSATLLVSLEGYTLAMVERNAELMLQRRILGALNSEYEGQDVEQVFEEMITIEEIDGITLYRAENGNVAFKFTGGGLWGPISGIVALRPDLETIEGIAILEQQETPGLGGRIAEKEFQEQFKGVVVDPQLVILPSSETAVKPNEVDGISGATMTGEFLADMINRQISNVRQVLEVE